MQQQELQRLYKLDCKIENVNSICDNSDSVNICKAMGVEKRFRFEYADGKQECTTYTLKYICD